MRKSMTLKRFAAEADEVVRGLADALVITRGNRPCAIVVPFDAQLDENVLSEDEFREAVLKADREVAEGEFVQLEHAQRIVRKVWAAREK